MKIVLSFSTILVSTLFCLAQQNEVILISGERIPFQKLNYNASSIKVKQDKIAKEIPIEKVFAIFTEPDQFLYNKPALPKQSKDSYKFIPVRNEGVITIYREVVQGNKEGSEITYLFAEKNKLFESIYASNSTPEVKKSNIEVTKSMVSDDPQSRQFVESSEFKYSEEGIIQLIGNYNLKTIPWVNNSTSVGEKIDVIFFERNNPRILPKIYLSKDEGYSINGNNEIKIRLDKNKLFKVCLDSLMNSCQSISTASPVNKYYSINKLADGKVVILNSYLKEARYYIKGLTE